jgi:hypothetical protein
MSITEIKASLHSVIDNIDDEEALLRYLRLLMKEVEPKGISFTLTAEQRKSVDEAIADLDAGKGTPHEVVKNRLKNKYPGIIK